MMIYDQHIGKLTIINDFTIWQIVEMNIGPTIGTMKAFVKPKKINKNGKINKKKMKPFVDALLVKFMLKFLLIQRVFSPKLGTSPL